MVDLAERVAPEVVAEVERVLRERLAPFRFARAEIRGARDHADEPALYIDVYYEPDHPPIDPSIAVTLIGELRQALEALGEYRFPYARHRLEDKPRVARSR